MPSPTEFKALPTEADSNSFYHVAILSILLKHLANEEQFIQKINLLFSRLSIQNRFNLNIELNNYAPPHYPPSLLSLVASNFIPSFAEYFKEHANNLLPAASIEQITACHLSIKSGKADILAQQVFLSWTQSCLEIYTQHEGCLTRLSLIGAGDCIIRLIEEQGSFKVLLEESLMNLPLQQSINIIPFYTTTPKKNVPSRESVFTTEMLEDVIRSTIGKIPEVLQEMAKGIAPAPKYDAQRPAVAATLVRLDEKSAVLPLRKLQHEALGVVQQSYHSTVNLALQKKSAEGLKKGQHYAILYENMLKTAYAHIQKGEYGQAINLLDDEFSRKLYYRLIRWGHLSYAHYTIAHLFRGLSYEVHITKKNQVDIKGAYEEYKLALEDAKKAKAKNIALMLLTNIIQLVQEYPERLSLDNVSSKRVLKGYFDELNLNHKESLTHLYWQAHENIKKTASLCYKNESHTQQEFVRQTLEIQSLFVLNSFEKGKGSYLQVFYSFFQAVTFSYFNFKNPQALLQDKAWSSQQLDNTTAEAGKNPQSDLLYLCLVELVNSFKKYVLLADENPDLVKGQEIKSSYNFMKEFATKMVFFFQSIYCSKKEGAYLSLVSELINFLNITKEQIKAITDKNNRDIKFLIKLERQFGLHFASIERWLEALLDENQSIINHVAPKTGDNMLHQLILLPFEKVQNIEDEQEVALEFSVEQTVRTQLIQNAAKSLLPLRKIRNHAGETPIFALKKMRDSYELLKSIDVGETSFFALKKLKDSDDLLKIIDVEEKFIMQDEALAKIDAFLKMAETPQNASLSFLVVEGEGNRQSQSTAIEKYLVNQQYAVFQWDGESSISSEFIQELKKPNHRPIIMTKNLDALDYMSTYREKTWVDFMLKIIAHIKRNKAILIFMTPSAAVLPKLLQQCIDCLAHYPLPSEKQRLSFLNYLLRYKKISLQHLEELAKITNGYAEEELSLLSQYIKDEIVTRDLVVKALNDYTQEESEKFAFSIGVASLTLPSFDNEKDIVDVFSANKSLDEQRKRLMSDISTGEEKHILLYGPNGSGKRTAAQRLARASFRALITISTTGQVSNQKLKQVMDKAKSLAPSILFINDIDKFIAANHEEVFFIKAQMAKLIQHNVVVLGKTSNKGHLTDEILNHFSTQIEFTPLSTIQCNKTIRAILLESLKQLKIDLSPNSTAEANCFVDAVLESSCTSTYTAVLCSASPRTSLSSASLERGLIDIYFDEKLAVALNDYADDLKLAIKDLNIYQVQESFKTFVFLLLQRKPSQANVIFLRFEDIKFLLDKIKTQKEMIAYIEKHTQIFFRQKPEPADYKISLTASNFCFLSQQERLAESAYLNEIQKSFGISYKNIDEFLDAVIVNPQAMLQCTEANTRNTMLHILAKLPHLKSLDRTKIHTAAKCLEALIYSRNHALETPLYLVSKNDPYELKKTLYPGDILQEGTGIQEVKSFIRNLENDFNVTGHFLLLEGPPGNGKTETVKIYLSAQGYKVNEWVGGTEEDKYHGAMSARVIGFFKQGLLDASNQSKMVILLIDEISGVCYQQNGVAKAGHYNHETVVDEFQTQLNELKGKRVLVIGTTNYPNRLAPAILSRVHRIVFPSPDFGSREKLMPHLFRFKCITQEAMQRLCEHTAGWSIRQMVKLVEQIMADHVSEQVLDAAFEKTLQICETDFKEEFKNARLRLPKFRVEAQQAVSQSLVATNEFVQEAFRTVSQYLRSPDLYPANVRLHTLLHGEPGGGKTTAIRKFAETCNCAFILIEAGILLSDLQYIFERAKLYKVAIICIDEIDKIACDGSSSKDLLIEQMDGFLRNRIIVVGATNYPERISGQIFDRFGMKVRVLMPTAAERGLFIRHMIQEGLRNLVAVQMDHRLIDEINQNCVQLGVYTQDLSFRDIEDSLGLFFGDLTVKQNDNEAIDPVLTFEVIQARLAHARMQTRASIVNATLRQRHGFFANEEQFLRGAAEDQVHRNDFA